jgi:glutamyl-tRNA synthetase/glutamyl-Q tRNA(Asp) synthetase
MVEPLPWTIGLHERLPQAPWRTRFAPAPTGFLHLGHLANALHVWGLARAFGGQVLLRLEDHDRSRCRPAFEGALLDTLDWLGLEPDQFPTASFRAEPASHPARQSNQDARYGEALDRLDADGLVYPCSCSRKMIADPLGLPDGTEARYPGTCRTASLDPELTPARRVRMAPGAWSFDDLRLGPLAQEPAVQCGDLLVRDRLGQWTYQFAVVVDDLAHGIDVVIRGEDLLASTGRQLQLAALLGRSEPPLYCHHPLLVHPDGRKLSKAGQDTSVLALRDAGWTVPALMGHAAWRAGLMPTDRPVPFQAVVDRLAGAS